MARRAGSPSGGRTAARGEPVETRDVIEVEGGLIQLGADGLLGWAWDRRRPEAIVDVIVSESGQPIARGQANIFDHEVVRKRIGAGIPAFLMQPFASLPSSFPVSLELHTEDGRRLGGPLVIRDASDFEAVVPDDANSYEGFVEAMKDGYIVGWAWTPSRPDHAVTLELFDGDERLDRVTASLYRPDLAALGKRKGCCGFRFDLPVSLLDNRSHTLKIRLANSQTELGGASLQFGPQGASPLLAEVAMLRAEVGNLQKLIERISSPQGEVQASLVRTLSERVFAVLEIQRETIDRELDALRKIAIRSANMPAQDGAAVGAPSSRSSQTKYPQGGRFGILREA